MAGGDDVVGVSAVLSGYFEAVSDHDWLVLSPFFECAGDFAFAEGAVSHDASACGVVFVEVCCGCSNVD